MYRIRLIFFLFLIGALPAMAGQGAMLSIKGNSVYGAMLQSNNVSCIGEKLLFTTTFSDYPNLAANSNCPINEDKTARYTNERVRVKVYNTEINADRGYMMAAKGKMPYNIIVGPLRNITKVNCKVKGNWKIEVKGDGDSDWTELNAKARHCASSSSNGNKSCKGCVSLTINRSNCQIRFTSRDFSSTPYLYRLDIYGNVEEKDLKANNATIRFFNTDGDVIATTALPYGATLGALANKSYNIAQKQESSSQEYSQQKSSLRNMAQQKGSQQDSSRQGDLFLGWSGSINGSKPVSSETVISGNTDLYPIVRRQMNANARWLLAVLDSIKRGNGSLASGYSGYRGYSGYKCYSGYNGYKIIPLRSGTYDFGNLTELELPCDSIVFLGAGMDSTILVTTPEPYKERLGIADFFYNTRNDIIFKDLTLYNALNKGGKGGRAAVINDCGNRTIYDHVRMLSIQDTYFSNNNSMQSYFKDCDIHGIVDFICGGGDVRFDNCTISLEPRGNGRRIITAPSTTTKFGYVFDNCRIVDLGSGEGSWVYGRTWRNAPKCVWINTKLDAKAAKGLVKSRWVEKGMNNTDPIIIGEYNTMSEDGRSITPESNIITSYDGQHDTILTKKQAKEFSYDNMFTNWNPKATIMR